MKVCITNTVVEVDPSAKTFKENLYIGGGVLTIGAPLIIRLHSVSLQTRLLQCNHITLSAQLIWRKKNPYQGLTQNSNNNTDYKDDEADQGSPDSYQVIT